MMDNAKKLRKTWKNYDPELTKKWYEELNLKL